MAADGVVSVQVFGYRVSPPTRAAIRFFRERRVPVTFVDLARRPIARGELLRFVQKFGAAPLMDQSSPAFHDGGLAWLKQDEGDIIERLLADPRLLRLPLVRTGNRLAVGADERTWRTWLDPA